MKYKIFILILFFILCIISPIFFYIFEYNEIFFRQLASIDSYLKKNISLNYFFWLTIFFTFNFTSTAFNVPGGSLKCIVAGYYFGLPVGFAICLIPITFGSYIMYSANFQLISRVREQKFIKIINFLNKKYLDHPYFILIIVRLLLFIPLPVQNLFLASLKINGKKFILTSLIGLFPTIFIYNLIGTFVGSISELQIVNFSSIKESNLLFLFIFLVLIVIVFSIILSKIEKNFK